MATNIPAFTELFELIDENKTTMPEYVYMKMMDCMMTISKTNGLYGEDVTELRRLRERNTLLTKNLYKQHSSKKRCSICKSTTHTKDTCNVGETIIIKDCAELWRDGGSYPVELYLYADKSNYDFCAIVDALTDKVIGRVYPVDKVLTPAEMMYNIIIPHPTDPTRKLQLWVREIEKYMINGRSTAMGMAN